MTDVDSDHGSWADRAADNQDNEARSYADVTNGPVPQNVPQPAMLNHDDDVRTTTFADNNLPKRPCSIFFKLAFQALNMRSLFQDLSRIGILPSSVRCLQQVSKGAYVITFSNSDDRQKFSNESSFISRPHRAITTVHVYDAPFELPDSALKLRLQPYGEVLKITRGRFPECTHVETGVRYVRMHVDFPIPSFIRFGRRLVRTFHVGQQRTCRRCNQSGHQAKECRLKFCFNCEEVGHEAPDCTKNILCSICKEPSHLAKNCPCGWITPHVQNLPVQDRPEVLSAPQPVQPDLHASQELIPQPPSPQVSPSHSSQSSQSSSSSSESSSSAVSPSFSPNLDPVLSGDDSDNADITESVPVPDPQPPPPRNLTTGSDEEMAQAVISDVNMLNSSMQSTDVDVDQDLCSAKRSAETSDREFTKVTRKKKR